MTSRHRTPYSEIFEVTNRSEAEHHPLPSEMRNFAPTPSGWAGVLVATGILAWLIWRQGGEDAGLSWFAGSIVVGYFVAAMGWTAIRRELDKREDLNRTR